MTTPRLLAALTVLNLVLLVLSLRPPRAVRADGPPPVLRGRALEIVDDGGRVRATIGVVPADPDSKMPDGTTGSPETVLLRLISAKGRPNVKLAATERGAGLLLGGETDPTYVQILADGTGTSLEMIDKDGREHVVGP